MNFASFAPVNYGLEPMELTPLTKRMSDVLTLADMMDKSKANKLALQKAESEMADAERKRQTQEALRAQATKEFETFNASAPSMANYPSLPIPTPVTAANPQDVYNELIGLKANTPENIERMREIYPNIAPAEATFSPYSDYSDYKEIDNIIKSKGDTAYGLRLPSVEGYAAELPETPKTYEEFAATSPITQERATQEETKRQVEEANAAELAKREAEISAYTPESRIPKGFKWMSPDEYSYMLKARTLDPEYADEYIKNLVDQKYKMSQTKKLEEEFGKEDETKLLKTRLIKHDRISNMINGLVTESGETPDPLAIQQRWPGIIRQAREYGITEEQLPTVYDPIAANNFVSESAALKGKIKTDPQFQQELKLRGEFQDRSKNYLTVRDAYSAMRNTPDTPAGDMALIYQFMKSNDPGSTVRESEFALAASTGNLGAKIQNLVGQVMTGRKLTVEQRNDLLNTAKASYGSYEKNWKNTKSYYNTLANNYDLDSVNITGGFDLAPQTTEIKFKPKPKSDIKSNKKSAVIKTVPTNTKTDGRAVIDANGNLVVLEGGK